MAEQITFKDWLKHRFPGVTRTQEPGSTAAVMMEAMQECWETSAVIEREKSQAALMKASALLMSMQMAGIDKLHGPELEKQIQQTVSTTRKAIGLGEKK